MPIARFDHPTLFTAHVKTRRIFLEQPQEQEQKEQKEQKQESAPARAPAQSPSQRASSEPQPRALAQSPSYASITAGTSSTVSVFQSESSKSESSKSREERKNGQKPRYIGVPFWGRLLGVTDDI